MSKINTRRPVEKNVFVEEKVFCRTTEARSSSRPCQGKDVPFDGPFINDSSICFPA